MIYPPDALCWSNDPLEGKQIADIVLNYINSGMIALNGEGIMIACNAVAQKMLEVNEQVIGTPHKINSAGG